MGIAPRSNSNPSSFLSDSTPELGRIAMEVDAATLVSSPILYSYTATPRFALRSAWEPDPEQV